MEAFLFLIGGALYYLIEVLWRGYSHWTMFILGGICFVIMGLLNEYKFKWNDSLIKQSIISACIITVFEFFTGCIVNLWLGWNVWDYSAFTTVYRELDGVVQFSNDGSIYVPPAPTPEPEPYVPTLEEVKASKVAEMNATQQSVIQQGIDVTLTDGTVEHFTLTDHDQTSLMGLQTQVAQGAEQIPWHTSDTTEHCKYYSNADMLLIVTAAMQYVTFHVTYFRDLRIYINALEDKESVEAVAYGVYIPVEYQSEVLKDLYAAMGV